MTEHPDRCPCAGCNQPTPTLEQQRADGFRRCAALYASVLTAENDTEANTALMQATGLDPWEIALMIGTLAGTVQDLLDQAFGDWHDPERLEWIADRADTIRNHADG